MHIYLYIYICKYVCVCMYVSMCTITMLVLIKCNQNAMGNNYMPLIIL